MDLKGEVIYIVFSNEQNGYKVIKFKAEKETITVTGILPDIFEGDILTLYGTYKLVKKYGQQFEVDSFQKEMPQSEVAIIKYLSNGNIRGVGKVLAERIVKKFKENTIEILRKTPERLKEIKGITKETAINIGENFNENWEVWKVVAALAKYSISAEHAKRAYTMYGTLAINVIEKTPYRLIDVSRNITFKQIDKIAINNGTELTDSDRIESAIKYILMNAANDGNSCMNKKVLVSEGIKLTETSKEIIENTIINMSAKEFIKSEIRDGEAWIYLSHFAEIENQIAENLFRLKNAKQEKKLEDIELKIVLTEKKLDIELSEKQKEAIKLINNNNTCIVTGGPGTGKTTIIRSIIELYENTGKNIRLCAPTGRAAKRMSETTKKEALTLHKMLELTVDDDDRRYISNNDYEVAPLEADIVIVDEISMIDMFLMRTFLKSIYTGTKVVFVGDQDQLASVGPGNVLKDMILSEKIPTVCLDKIFRQAAKSKIIVNAHRINSGEMFISKEEVEDMNDDFFFINEYYEENMVEEILSLSSGRLQNYGEYDFFRDMQILTPTRKGMLGTKEINQVLQRRLNPGKLEELTMTSMGAIFRVGDKVMQMINNYEIGWEKKIKKGMKQSKGIYNGEMGIINDIYMDLDEMEYVAKIKFDDGKVAYYKKEDMQELEHSYAITIHKSQGSEFNVVILVIPRTNPKLLTRNLLYTAITRAKKLIVVVAPEDVIKHMSKNIETKKRNTGLKYKIERLISKKV